MDRQELSRLIAHGPVRIRMTDGETVDVTHARMATVSDTSAAVLVHDEDGRLRHRYLALVRIRNVEELSETPEV